MLISRTCFPSRVCFFSYSLCDSFFLWLCNLPSFITSVFTIHFHASSPTLHSFCTAFVLTQVTPFLASILLIPVYRVEVSETNTRMSLCQLIVIELWSQQVLTAAGCHNAECSLGACNCQVTVGIVPRGLFKVVLRHSGSLQ